MTHVPSHRGHEYLSRQSGGMIRRNCPVSDEYLKTGGQVLLVQHNIIELCVMEAMLKALGYHVTTAGDIDHATVRFSQKRPDIIVSELDMPAVSGFRLARRIKIHAPETRIVMLTARCQAEVVNLMNSRVVDAWLFKPFQLQVLGDLLLCLEQQRNPGRNVENRDKPAAMQKNWYCNLH